MQLVTISAAKKILIGEKQPLVLFCGPCVIESRDHALKMSNAIAEIAARVGFPLVYKSSYDKANRTSGSAFRGLGIEGGLKILAEIKKSLGVPVITDVHSEPEVEMAAGIADVLQIPAFLCRQTSLLQRVGALGRTVLIKKGQFLHPADMKFAAEKVEEAGDAKALLCERGSCFGYRELIVDFRGLGIMRGLGYPVVFDATHSVQVMGGNNGSSGGARGWVAPLARAAAAFGIDGLFLECHNDPDSAPSDGPNMVRLSELEKILESVKRVREAAA